MTQVDRRLGDMIRECREKLEITQEEMAERVQVNLTHYGNIERGVNNPSLPLFFKIAKELNFSVDSYLYSEQHVADNIIDGITRLLCQCSERERRIILANIHTLINERDISTSEDCTE